MLRCILSAIATITILTLPLGAWAQESQAGDATARSSGQTAPAADEGALKSSLRDAETGEAVVADEEETVRSGYGGVNFVERGGSGTPLYSILLHGGDLQFALNSDGSVKSSPDPAVAQRNGAMDGEQAAKSAGTAVWWLAGAGGGCLLGGLGCLGVTAVGGFTEPGVDFSYASDQNYSEPARRAYRQAYSDAYTKKLKGRRALHAFLGGTITTTVALSVLVALVLAGG